MIGRFLSDLICAPAAPHITAVASRKQQGHGGRHAVVLYVGEVLVFEPKDGPQRAARDLEKRDAEQKEGLRNRRESAQKKHREDCESGERQKGLKRCGVKRTSVGESSSSVGAKNLNQTHSAGKTTRQSA